MHWHHASNGCQMVPYEDLPFSVRVIDENIDRVTDEVTSGVQHGLLEVPDSLGVIDA